MATEQLLIDAWDTDLPQKIDALKTTPGTCIFIDVVGSTAMKQRSLREWILLLQNVFAEARGFLGKYRPLKGIGDELMYFIEDRDLGGETHLQIFDALFSILGNASNFVPETKIVAAHCRSVYALSFLEGAADYYGQDVDRAARLKSVQPALATREIVIDDSLSALVKKNYDACGNKSQFPSVTRLSGPTNYAAKGIPGGIDFYRAKV